MIDLEIFLRMKELGQASCSLGLTEESKLAIHESDDDNFASLIRDISERRPTATLRSCLSLCNPTETYLHKYRHTGQFGLH